MGSLVYIPVGERSLPSDVQALANQFARLDVSEPNHVLACMISRSSLYECIREHQHDDPHFLVLKDTMRHSGAKQVIIGDDGVLQMCLQDVHDLRQHYWWRRIKKDIVVYVAQCLNCQQIKFEYQRPGGLLQKLEIPEWN
ncbi:uncharacterized protein [Nicotiana sylvestris]|uniref:uncharacterized protein n=1 Tax=Nicotiana sylvestris TaxID=4096 RepID=UPI00388C3E34